MARSNAVNYTKSGDAFTKANAVGDAFNHTDVQVLGQAVDDHDHSAGLGLPVARLKAGTLASRPAAGNVGAFYFATDNGHVYEDDGTSWHDFAAIDATATLTNKTLGSGSSFSVEAAAPDFKATGLTGATAASRYVGATASGAPASGTFAVGDYVLDQTGKLWICTTAGTPGTWTAVGGLALGGGVGGDAATSSDGTASTAAHSDHHHAGMGQLIADTLLAASATNITFSSIPQTFKHLRLVLSGRADGALVDDFVAAQVNGDGGASSYDYSVLELYGATVTSAQASGASHMRVGVVTAASNTTGATGISEILIPDYASTTLRKALSGSSSAVDDSTAHAYVVSFGGSWTSMAALTSLKLYPESSTNFVAGTRASLYGVN